MKELGRARCYSTTGIANSRVCVRRLRSLRRLRRTKFLWVCGSVLQFRHDQPRFYHMQCFRQCHARARVGTHFLCPRFPVPGVPLDALPVGLRAACSITLFAAGTVQTRSP